MNKIKQSRPVYVLFKSRSYRADYNESVSLLMTNIKTFLFSLFPPAVASGLVFAVVFILLRHAAGYALVAEAGIALLLLAFLVALLRQVLNEMMKDFPQTNALKRIKWKTDVKGLLRNTLKPFYLLLLQLLVCIALFAVGYSMQGKSVWVWLPVAAAVVFLVVPFNLSLNSLQYSGTGFLPAIVQGFKSVRHYYGSTLILLFLSLIVLALVSVLCFLPIFILNMAISASNEALALGDLSDLPTSVYVWHFVLSLVLFAVMQFSLLLWAFPQYFHHFSLMRKEADRKKEQDKLLKVNSRLSI